MYTVLLMSGDKELALILGCSTWRRLHVLPASRRVRSNTNNKPKLIFLSIFYHSALKRFFSNLVVDLKSEDLVILRNSSEFI